MLINTDYWRSCIISSSKQHMTIMLNNVAGAQCIMTVVYALNLAFDRVILWKELIKESNTYNIPWCVMGDFNRVRFINEKQGGRSLNLENVQELNKFITSTAMSEMKISGVKFSWRSGPGKNIATRIDRVFCNLEWMRTFINSNAQYLQLSTSDHVRILMQFSANRNNDGAKPFKFLNHWIYSKGYEEVTEKMFRFPLKNQLFNLVNIQKGLKQVLKKWSFGKFSMQKQVDCHRKEVSCALEEVEKMHNTQNALKLKNAQDMLKSSLEKLAIETQQKAKCKWLKWNDECSKKFYAKLTTRRFQNNVHNLLDTSGNVVKTSKEIENEAIQYFHSLYNADNLASKFPRIIPKEKVNEAGKNFLNASFSEEEIK